MFSIGDLFKMVGGSFTVATAYIKIRDMRALADADMKTDAPDKAAGGNALGMKGLDKIPGGNDALKGLQEKAKSAAASAISSVGGGGLGGLISNKLGLKGGPRADDYDRIFKVQFAPTSLQISSQGGGEIVQKSSYASSTKATTIEMGVTKPHIEMSVSLIFDGLTQDYKAFATGLANFSTTNLINEGYGLATDLLTEKKGGENVVSIQSAVEGFVGAMRNNFTHQVCFEWGDMYYEGELKSINTTYTMFDSVGRPIRAKVNIAIYLQDDNITNGDMGYWETAYEKIFKNGSVDLSGGTAKNVAKSLLNF